MKNKKRLCILGIVSGVFLGSITAFAGSYVQGYIPGTSRSCTGSLAYYNHAITATTNCDNGAEKYTTTLRGAFIRGTKVMPERVTSGSAKAQLYDSYSTKCDRAKASHAATYLKKTWRGETSI